MTQTRDGATTALHRRIEELTAELAMSRAKYDRDISDKEIAHQVDLATERAAREQAEELRLSYWKETQLAKQRAEQAERERDTALARVKELEEAEHIRTLQRDDMLDAYRAAETALASSQARVKELEAELREALDLLQSKEGERLMRMAAETALASARILIEQAADGEHEWSPKFRGECSRWLTSHPAPVAAPSVVIPTENQAWAVLDRFFGSHENDAENRSDDAHVEAYAAYRVITESRDLAVAFPVAAPCAGCALLLRRLRELTEYYMLEVRNSEDRLKRVHRLQAQLARVGTRLHVKRAEAAHWQSLYSNRIKRCLQCRDLEARLEEVQHCCDKAVENRATIERMEADYDACHRQHEQCMKLLELVEHQLMEHPRTLALVRTMLSKGELPEGWDDK